MERVSHFRKYYEKRLPWVAFELKTEYLETWLYKRPGKENCRQRKYIRGDGAGVGRSLTAYGFIDNHEAL